MVQEEFRSCFLFRSGGAFAALCAHPAYAEMVLVAFLRSMGVMDNDTRLRFKWARSRLVTLLTAQRVKSPRTSTHLLRAVVNSFLLMIPLCSGSYTTKLATPFIALILVPLMQLSEELEDPFGLDKHDLPWPILL